MLVRPGWTIHPGALLRHSDARECHFLGEVVVDLRARSNHHPIHSDPHDTKNFSRACLPLWCR